MKIINELEKILEGEVSMDSKIIEEHSTDASLFQVNPRVVVFPKSTKDVKKVVNFVKKHKKNRSDLSITARSAGTDMSGGPLNDSIILSFTKNMNSLSLNRKNKIATVEPGLYHRDFEKEVYPKKLFLPSYPASKDLCAFGGLINNNSGGELTLRYGKTNRYVKKIKIVLSDGNEYTFAPITKKELEAKCKKKNFEGKIYKKTYNLILKNYALLQKAKPNVSKNSAGYALWDIYDKENEMFDMTQLIVGSQGTLGMVTKAEMQLITIPKHRRLAVLFLKDWKQIPQIVNSILPQDPESMEVFDDATLKLALKFFPEIAKKADNQNLIKMLLQFIPEFFIGLKMLGLPKLVILVEVAEHTKKEADEKLDQLEKKMKEQKIIHRLIKTEEEAEKYWTIRRESFGLLREHVKEKRTAPFIDDIIVRPEVLPEVLPKVLSILKQYKIKATLAGHAGDGNFHIIPLMNLSDPKERKKIPIVSKKVYDIVLKYKGSITAEHNDGLIRSPYLEQMYGRKVYGLFKEVKEIFDPQNIFNPRKKISAGIEYANSHINHA